MKILKMGMVFLLVAAASLTACSGKENQNSSQNAPAKEQQQQDAAPDALQMEPPEILQPQQPDAAQQKQPGAQMHPSAGEQVQISGKVERSTEGFVIRSIDESFMVAGKDLSDMVGKEVRASGVLAEGGGTRTIEVHEVQIME